MKLSAIFINYLAIILVCLLTSCAPLEPSDHTAKPEPTRVLEGGDQSRDGGAITAPAMSITEVLKAPESITFKEVKTLVFNSACLGCHSSSGKVSSNVMLDAYEHIMGANGSKAVVVPFSPQESNLYRSLLVESGSRRMPPIDMPQITEDQKNLVFLWISNGAKKEVSQVAERPPSLRELLAPFFLNPETIDFSVVKTHLFEAKCMECHSSRGIKADINGAIMYGQDMTDYQDFFTNSGIVKDHLSDYVVFEDGKLKKKKGSRIYRSVAIQQTMPPPADGYDPIDSNRIKLLRLWIENCAIESYSDILQDSLLDVDDPIRVNGKVRDCIEGDGQR